MNFADEILAEFEEAATATRRYLERIPEDKLTWRPAEKSLTAGELGLHLAEASGFGAWISTQASVEMQGPMFRQPASVGEILQVFEEGVAKVRQHLAGREDRSFDGTVSFTNGGVPVFSFGKRHFTRMLVLSHLYHHRGQLSVYLRELGVPVPSSFGPTADEPMPPAGNAA